MEIFGKILLIIGLILLVAITCYEIYALVRDCVKRAKKRKQDKKEKADTNTTEKVEKGK